jgi:hypothetical protein
MKLNSERRTKGGSILLDYILSNGKEATELEAFDILDSAGYNEKEKIEIVKTVLAFMRHEKGVHNLCPKGMCDNQRKHELPKDKIQFSDKEVEDMR